MIVRSICLGLPGHNYSDLVVELYDGQNNQAFGSCQFDLKQSNSGTILNLSIGEIAFNQMQFIKIKWLDPENRWEYYKSSKLDWMKIRAMKPVAIKERNN